MQNNTQHDTYMSVKRTLIQALPTDEDQHDDFFKTPIHF